MSICRFSDLNYGCDLYLYEGDGGWTLHVAQSRYPEGIPELPPLPLNKDDSDWFAQYINQTQWLKENRDQLQEINLPYAGQSFGFTYPEDCIKFCKELRDLGYRFPDHVLERESY